MSFTPNRNFFHVRSAAILTDAYVAGTILTDCESYNALFIDAYFTIGSLTNAILKVEFSEDGTNYTQETHNSVTTSVNTHTAGTHLIAATGNYSIYVPLSAKYVKISSIGTGTATSSSLKVDVRLGMI